MAPHENETKRSRNKVKLAFNVNLRALMKARKVTFEQLATVAGVSRSTLSDWCSGTHPNNLVAVKKITEFFGVDFEKVLFEDITASLADESPN